jgi:hypothetical protein
LNLEALRPQLPDLKKASKRSISLVSHSRQAQLESISLFRKNNGIDMMADIEFRSTSREGCAFKFETWVEDKLFRQVVQPYDRRQPQVMIPLQSLHRFLHIGIIRLSNKDTILHFPGLGPNLPSFSVELSIEIIGVDKRPLLEQMRLEGSIDSLEVLKHADKGQEQVNIPSGKDHFV